MQQAIAVVGGKAPSMHVREGEGLGRTSSRVGGGVLLVNEVDSATFESDINVLQRLRQIDLT